MIVSNKHLKYDIVSIKHYEYDFIFVDNILIGSFVRTGEDPRPSSDTESSICP